jgi:hypothetical protein
MAARVIHRFVRNPNIDSNIHNRVANRFAPFTNTLTTLTDPQHGRTLTLIGTTNSSTTLAHRTQALLEKLSPDAVYVQASPEWWSHAKHVQVLIRKYRLIIKNYSRRSAKISQKLLISSKITSEDCFSEQDCSLGNIPSKAYLVTLK